MRSMAILVLICLLPLAAAAQETAESGSGIITFGGTITIGSALGILGLIFREMKKGRDFKKNNGRLADMKDTIDKTHEVVTEMKEAQGVVKNELKNIKENCKKQQASCGRRIGMTERLVLQQLETKK